MEYVGLRRGSRRKLLQYCSLLLGIGLGAAPVLAAGMPDVLRDHVM